MKNPSTQGNPATEKTKAVRSKSKSKLPKLIDQYYADLAELAHQSVMYESGTRTAFHNLLAGAGREWHWTLIPELERKPREGKPDGVTLLCKPP